MAGLTGAFGGLARSAAPSGKKLVLVLARGGWDTTFCLDPKLGIPTIAGPEVDEDPTNPDDVESVQTFDGIPVVVNDVKRPSVSAFFDQWASRSVVVRGISIGAIAHDPCRMRIMTGQSAPGHGDLSAIAGNVHGATLPLGSVDLGGISFVGPLAASTGRVGFRHQIQMLVDADTAFKAPKSTGLAYPLFAPSSEEQGAVAGILSARAERLRTARGQDAASSAQIDGYLESIARGQRIRIEGADVIAGLKFGAISGFVSNLGVAVDLLAGGLCAAVCVDTGKDWDTHVDNSTQHDSYEETFSGLSTLAQGLDDAGLLEDTLVAVLSEMTRTPAYNEDAGKDHWPHTCALLFGGGIAGGRVCGGTDDLLESLPIDLESGEVLDSGAPCGYDNLAAGILELVDVDPAEWLPGVGVFRGAKPT